MTNLKHMVEEVLKEFPKARDDDQWLTLKIWAKYYPSKIFLKEEYVNGIDDMRHKVQAVTLKDILELPREDNVKRHRAVFQNDKGMYLPTCLEVVKQRKQNEKRWKEIISNEYKRL